MDGEDVVVGKLLYKGACYELELLVIGFERGVRLHKIPIAQMC